MMINSFTALKQKTRKLDRSPFRTFRRSMRHHSTDNKYWNPFVDAFKFIIHFVVVMLLLYCSALVFARLEDPDVMYGTGEPESKIIDNDTSAEGVGVTRTSCGNGCDKQNYDSIWKSLELKYNLSVPLEFRDEVWKRLSRKDDDDDHSTQASVHLHHRSSKTKDDDVDDRSNCDVQHIHYGNSFVVIRA